MKPIEKEPSIVLEIFCLHAQGRRQRRGRGSVAPLDFHTSY